MKGLINSLLGASLLLAGSTGYPPLAARPSRKIYTGHVFTKKQWQRRRARLRLTKASRKANRG